MAQQIIIRNGTALQWTTADPILLEGEIGYETDTNKLKIGNGIAVWSILPYFSSSQNGGGALYINAIDAPPAIPHAKDDEFDGGLLDPKWAWNNKGTSGEILVNGKILMDIAPMGDGSRSIIQTSPVGNFTAIGKIVMDAFIEDYYGFGIGFFNSANTKVLFAGIRHQASRTGVWWCKAANTTWNGEGIYLGYPPIYMYVKIQRVGTILKLFYSNTGAIWHEILSEDVSVFVGVVTHIGLIAFRNNTNAAHKQFGICDWFRVTES